MQKRLWAIVRPMQSNSGKPFTVEHHRAWEDNVIGTFGGATFLPVADGAWKHGGMIFREPMQQINVIGTWDQMLNLVRETMLHYDQLAIMWHMVAHDPHITYREEIKEGTGGL